MEARLQRFESCHRARNPGRPRKTTVTGFITAIILLWLVTLSSNADPSAARFKNLQVLPEDASTVEVFQVMKLITRALGTECRTCHLTAERDFASDERVLKVTARVMMRLEQARRPDLSWVDPPVTLCIECHQGQLRPASVPKPVSG